MTFQLTTERLCLTELDAADVTFIFELFNDPDCLRFIGDRGIHTQADASSYLQDRLMASYRDHGYGLYKVSLKKTGEVMGICGLVKRDADHPPDLGFAFLPAHRGGGYCTEACEAILQWAQEQKVSAELLAYTDPENAASIRVLEKMGMQRQQVSVLPGQDKPSLILTLQLY